MTVILALGSLDQVIQISDRQLTDGDGKPCVLPENKATLLTVSDARLICGFAGLARTGKFRTGQWLADALLEAAEEDHLAHGTVERFTAAATERFARRDIARVSREHRGLSVLFTGYRDVIEARGALSPQSSATFKTSRLAAMKRPGTTSEPRTGPCGRAKTTPRTFSA